jgi:ferric-dicitrate binding protein FerR (iron transport regulator)
VPLVDTSDWRRVVERATPPSPAPGEEPVVNSTVWVPRGGEYTLTLADGTVVMINAASRLRFPSAFPGDERRVYLEGEALFRVERDAGRPFFVETADGTVKVLGTEFNVNAYPDNATTRATLVSGSIAFRAREIPGERLLRPGEQVIHDRETRETRVERVNTALYTAWTTGRWIIEGERLEEIMKQFARWYDARVIYQDPRARDLVFTGDLEKYANGETVLNIISMTTNVDFVVREDNTVTVKMR